MRLIAGVLFTGSIIAFFVGLVNFGGYVQMGGASGLVTHGWAAMLGAVLVFVGSGGVLIASSMEPWSLRAFVVPMFILICALVLTIATTPSQDELCEKGLTSPYQCASRR